jgi:hypothetical protein
MQKLKDIIEQEKKNEDIKRELRKGNIVQIIEDAFEYRLFNLLQREIV